MSHDDTLLFAHDEEDDVVTPAADGWMILVVDDEPEIHQITRLVLSDFEFEGAPISIISAESAAEARNLLSNDIDNNIAVAFVDVVMETQHAGLDLVRWVRDELENKHIRLVLRTGQPGEAPEESVIRDYDINDYKNKTELTAMRMKTVMYSALRGYRDIKLIERHRRGLEKIIAATSEFLECESLNQFASAILTQVSIVLGIESSEIVCCAVVREPQKRKELNLLATNIPGANPIAIQKGQNNIAPHIQARINQALEAKSNIYEEDYFIGYFTTKRGTENVLYVSKDDALESVQHHLLAFFANNIAVAHENLKLRDVIKESQKELSYLIGEAVEMRSKETGSHVKRVAHISYKLAVYYGLDEAEAEMIKLASPLHDVGKVGIPDQVLNKPGKHTPEEAAIMRTHSEIGYDMLRKSDNPILHLGAIIAHEHHECWDGTGYPQQLKGEDIHVAGRISAIADVFDALGSKRCYKAPWGIDQIRDYFIAGSGTRFEPKLVDILLAHFDEFADIRHHYPDPN